jgi:hypothetical protein
VYFVICLFSLKQRSILSQKFNLNKSCFKVVLEAKKLLDVWMELVL